MRVSMYETVRLLLYVCVRTLACGTLASMRNNAVSVG